MPSSPAATSGIARCFRTTRSRRPVLFAKRYGRRSLGLLMGTATLALFVNGCTPSNAPVREPVAPTLRGENLSILAIADALEALVARAADTHADRQFAYQRVRNLRAASAEDALGRAMIAGRLAQISGLSAPTLVHEVERYARQSAELDSALRAGAALRVLGTLYVMAPAALLSHGDSEPARPQLCYCLAHRAALRPDEQKLLEDLRKQVELGHCP